MIYQHVVKRYMNQVLNSSNININGYIEPYQENGGIVGYTVLFK